MSIIEFRKTSKHFGDLKVLDEVDLSIDVGEVVVLIGPSGSGKSTLLRCINGLEQISGGDLVMDGISVRAGKKQLRLIRQELGDAIAVAMELLRATSSSSKSMCAVPLRTLPMRVIAPVLKRRRSTSVVLPAPLCETRAMLRICPV